MSVFVPLKEAPWAKFGAGTKTVEVRNAKSPVAAQVRKAKPGDEVRLRWGYGPHGGYGIREFKGTLGRVWTADNVRNLPVEALIGANLDARPDNYGWVDDPVLAFEVILPSTPEGGERQ